MSARLVKFEPRVELGCLVAIARAKRLLRQEDVVGVALAVVFRDGSTGTLHSATGSIYGRALHSASAYLTNRIERDFYEEPER